MSTTTTTTTTTTTRSFLQPQQQQQQFKMTTNNNMNTNTNTNTHSQNEFDLLDIFSTDMDFEQAYNMYNTLQQKNALGSFEQLQKVQQLNQQYSSTLSNPIPTSDIHQFPDQFAYERAHILNGPHNLQQQQSQQSQQSQEGFVNNYINKNYSFNDPNIQNLPDEDEIDDDFDQFFTNTESNALEKFLDNLANPISTGNPLQFYNNNTNGGSSSLHNNHEIDFNFEMHTMKVPQHLKPRSHSTIDNNNQLPIPLPPSGPIQQVLQPQDPIQLKKDLTEAFANPSLSTFNQLPSPKDIHAHAHAHAHNNNNNDPILTNTNNTTTKKSKQLITPPTSGDESRKRNSDDESDEEEEEEEDDDDDDEAEEKQDKKDKTHNKPLKKRRRSSNKPLLSLEQKRLNHSNSEQKRRQLCKLAYERCLELIIDLDAFNKLPELNENERKSKRARVNKDGLPNLSKHNALIRISNEMILIKSMNENLKKFIENN